jgi:hypothetical protein
MLTVPRRRWGLCSVLVAVCALAAWLWILSQHGVSVAMLAEEAQPTPFTADYYTTVSNRFGAALNPRVPITTNGQVRNALITDYDVDMVHVGWYSDAGTNPEPLRPNGISYAQLILVKAKAYPTTTLELTATVGANPGGLWIIGNEPEGRYSQGDRTPAEYAEIYHEVYGLIKGLDPTAWIAIGGVIEPTPLRLRWLEMVLQEYESRFGEPMPVDVWNIHVQILQEKAGGWGAEIPAGLPDTEGRLYTLLDNANPDVFRQLVTEFRQWMKDQGFQNKPLIISEYGVLMPSTYIAPDGLEATGDQVLIDFMRETFEFLVNGQDPDLGYPADDHHLVQQWLWYSLNTQPYDSETGRGYNGSLFSHLDPTQITQFGVIFREHVHTLLGHPRILLPLMTRGVSPH